MSDKISAHVIEEGTGEMLARPIMSACPRVGDEMRIDDDMYYTVKRVIWCLDEISASGQRVNIGVERAP